MHIRDLAPGVHEGPIEITVESRSILLENLMRISVKDFTEKINIILEGNLLVKALEKIHPDTKITLSHFTVSENYDIIGQYFPSFIPGTNVATHGTKLS